MRTIRQSSKLLLLALLTFTFLFPSRGMAYDDIEGPGGRYHSDNKNVNYNRVILTYEKGYGGGGAGRSGLMSSVGGVRNFNHIPAGVVDLASSGTALRSAKSRKEILESYRRIPGVKTAEFEVIYRLKPAKPASNPADRPEQGQGAFLRGPAPHANQWYINSLNLSAAWGAEWGAPYGNGDFVVAVMDTGVDHNHPDLTGAMWDDGGGKHGYNYRDNNSNTMDGHGHGTHVAGIIAGTGAGRVTGVAAGVKVMALKIFDAEGNGGSDSLVLSSINYILEQKNNHGVDVRAVNMSFGGTGYSSAVKAGIDSLGVSGIAVFAAAGNETADNDYIPSFPANFPSFNLVSVGSLTQSNQVSSFSNYGKRSVGVYAYGSDIYSTYKGGGYASMNGTSMATPMACGAFLLSWSEDTTVPLLGALGRFHAGLIPMSGVGGGRVNVGEMLSKPKNSPAVFKVRDTIVAGDGEFSVFGNDLGDKALNLGTKGLSKTGDLPGNEGVKTRLNPFVTGDLWRKVKRAGGTDGDGPYAMVMEKINAPAGGGSGLDNYKPVGKNAMLVMGSETYLFAERKSPGDAFFLIRLDPDGNLDGEWEFTKEATGSDMRNYLKLFEYEGYIYLPGLVDFTKKYLYRFDLMNETFEEAKYGKSMEPLSHAVYATDPGGTAVYCAGAVHEGGAPAYKYLAQFNPANGELVKLKELPYKLWDTSIAYRNGKLYIAGGERMPEFFVFNNTNDCFVYDIQTGQFQENRKLPFFAKEGVLLFSKGKLVYAANETNGDGFDRQYMTAMTDLTKSGWVHKWETLPSVYAGALYDDDDTNKPRLLVKSNPSGGITYFSDQSGGAWDDTVMPIPEGAPHEDPYIPNPDPDDPKPPVPFVPGGSGGGGCNTGGGSESAPLLLGLLPVLFASRKRK